MQDIIYNPDDAGKEFLSNRGKVSKFRKFHMTIEEIEQARDKWLKELKTHPDREEIKKLKKKSGNIFFNPYRQGIYYYQVQTLFLLGANQWHSLTDIVKKLEEYTSGISLRKSVMKKNGYHSAWDKFRGKSSREFARSSKDYVGRIQENFVMLQRLSSVNPYGYKLHQSHGALDIKRVSRKGFSQGIYFYRLSTYKHQAEALPIKDFSEFNFPKHEGKYVSRKFIGTIVTGDKLIINGKVVANG